ncbi:hypothetical protein C8A01DRAFT_40806 [Parachaetomium inaequale]|uniref:Uncharacterized protein n=1 Tax=Parachaetomium inaequale TaxID=2588326 RepID=A0AAN6SM60_9PEZI|nr:hypothetical protein C8A01DRAFT_40806 [Parachaetomium inaequale]
MREVADALDAAVNDTSDHNLNALMKASNFDVRSLATLAIDDRNTPKSAALLLNTAMMLSESRATEAETKATKAENKAAEAQRRARTAENNSDGVLLRNHEHTHTLVSQRSQLGELEHRVAALESLPLVTSSSDDAGGDGCGAMALRRALAATNARLQIVEQQLERLMERCGDI